jgi:alkylglycerol monooxygenase
LTPRVRVNLIAYSIPIFFLLIGVELLVARAQKKRLYRAQDSINSLSCGVSEQVIDLGTKVWTFGSYVFLYEALAIVEGDEASVLVWIVGALGVDLAYYWFHRASHRVGFLWAAHVVHHQSEEYNLTTALRQSALQATFGAAFYWPLAILGLPPAVFVTLSTLNTLYQFWIHTRLVRSMGPLELVLNTPSHHRVHHGIDPKYIDKNYGGVLIVWDRLFGTFQREEEEPAFGTVKPLSSWNPLWANVEAWMHMIELARAAPRLRDKLYAFVAPPEWRPAELGGNVTIPEVDHATRVKYEQPRRPGLDLYVTAQFGLVAVAILQVLLTYSRAPLAHTLGAGAWILVSLLAWGGLFESKRWALPLEASRLLVAPLVVLAIAPSILLSPWAPFAWSVLAAGSLLWLGVLWRRWSVRLAPAVSH